ncbi:MAG: NCS2 family permease [Bacillota bacterium]|nr:MAG: NCS2 family permease [Bacillota bacterium]
MKKFFKIEERGTTVRTELIGGLVTFLAMAYILAANPFILGDTADPMPVGGVFVATAISAAIATIVMGLLANYPIALAPGMGINALVAYGVISTMGYSWEEAMAAVFISGIIFLVISLTSLRTQIIRAVPASLKKAIGAGIGFFIAFIGVKNAGIVVANPATFVSLGDLSNPTVLLALFGIVLALVLYAVRHKINKFALIIAILITAFVGVLIGLIFDVAGMPAFAGGYSDLSSFGETLFGFTKGLSTVFGKGDLWFVIFSLLFLDIFDTAGTLISVAEPAGLLDENGEMKDIDKALMSDAIGTVVGSIVGTSTVTSYIESSAGIESGARTGLSSVLVGALFLISIVAYPVFSIFINSAALTSMALVLVGVFMMSQLKGIAWDDKPSLAAAFITILMMVLNYSIGNGIAFGFMTYVLLMLVQGRYKEVTLTMYILSAAFVAYFVINAVV